MITITGATGNTGSKLADILLEKGKKIRVIGRTKKKLKRFADRGSEVLEGDQHDVGFLTAAFQGADAAYILIPPKMDAPDVRAYYNDAADTIVQAIRNSGLKRAVFLSSLGAERESGTGPVLGLHDAEKKLETLENTAIVFLRPGYFMENTLWNIPLIQSQHINGNSTAPDAPILMAAGRDIARKAADLLTENPFTGHSVTDLFGHRLTYAQATALIGKAISIPDLKYVRFPDEGAFQALKGMGLSDSVAQSFVDLSHGLNEGHIITTQGDPGRPNGWTTFKQFAEEVFRPAWKQAEAFSKAA